MKEMGDHRYILEKYSGPGSRYICPKCEKRSFTRYIDTNTGEYINASCGKCNHEVHCTYHYTPKQYFSDNSINPEPMQQKDILLPSPKPPSYISTEIFRSSLADYGHNHFATFLKDLFGDEITSKLIHKYNIGTSRHWQGAVVFWQTDIMGRVRTGKIMLYDATTGKRTKQPYDHITWVHTVLKLKDYSLKQCLFGEHLLSENTTATVAIAESEKTAIIASACLPQFTWLACGGLSNLTPERCAVLKDRTVILYPDAGCFEKWSAKAKDLSKFCNCKASNIIEKSATETEMLQGWDLADFLIKNNCTPPHEDQDIQSYWRMTPKVLSHFTAHPEDRKLFHREFCREYRPVDFTEFENYSLSIN